MTYEPRDRKDEFAAGGLTMMAAAERWGVSHAYATRIIKGKWSVCTDNVRERLDDAYEAIGVPRALTPLEEATARADRLESELGQADAIIDRMGSELATLDHAYKTIVAEQEDWQESVDHWRRQYEQATEACKAMRKERDRAVVHAQECERLAVEATASAIALPTTIAECKNAIATLQEHMRNLEHTLQDVLDNAGEGDKGWVVWEDDGKIGPVCRMPHPMARRQISEQYDELLPAATITPAQAAAVLDRIKMLEDK